MEKISVLDTTLRDGAQIPGFKMSLDEKLDLARGLKALNVDVIEAGIPAQSDDQFNTVRRIAEEVDGPIIAGFAWPREEDIATCYKALKGAGKPRVHTFLATSPYLMNKMHKRSPSELLKLAEEIIDFSTSMEWEVQFTAFDGSRSDPVFLCEMLDTVIEAGATIVNIPDSAGYSTPLEFGRLVRKVGKGLKENSNVMISVHCHNDLGLAVANTLAGIEAGARQVECSVNGIGDRAGNTSLEELVMALKSRKDYYDVEVDIHTQEIFPLSDYLCRTSGIAIHSYKPVVGINVFEDSIGIHQGESSNGHQKYTVMTHEIIGRPKGVNYVAR